MLATRVRPCDDDKEERGILGKCYAQKKKRKIAELALKRLTRSPTEMEAQQKIKEDVSTNITLTRKRNKTDNNMSS
jgi:hypothetical protein